MATRILLTAILCVMPAFSAAQTDTGRQRDVAAIRELIEQYTNAVDTVDPNLLSQIWSHSPQVSFIYPLGEEHGFDAIERQVFQNKMSGMFSARDLGVWQRFGTKWAIWCRFERRKYPNEQRSASSSATGAALRA